MLGKDLFIELMIKRFAFYKDLGEKAILQLDDSEIHRKLQPGDNSVAVIVKHVCGNLLSRFTDFLHSDGEKSWRNRDEEFIEDNGNKTALLKQWNEGWDCVISALKTLTDHDLENKVTIRGEEHLVFDAILRSIGHYSYHVGQIAFLAKTIKGAAWQSLSIPLNDSARFNDAMQKKFNS